ncbi:MAG: MMPL family transporter [Methylococcaceae bacterium]|nr:MMPL family transporter [Methylococcaceae bacterium]
MSVTITLRVAKLAERIALHPGWMLCLAGVFSALAVWAVLQLPVYTSRQALLPKNTGVAERLDSFLRKFGAASDLIVVVEGAPRDELESFATELAVHLRDEPEIGQATERFDPRFFLQHAYLMIPPERLEQFGSLVSLLASGGNQPLDAALRKALELIKTHPPLTGVNIQTAEESLAALGFLLEEWQRWLSAENPPDGLDWTRLLARYGAEAMGNGYFASRDGRMLFLFVHPKNAAEDFQSLKPFIDKVKAVSGSLAEQVRVAGRTPPKVALTGLPAIEYEEHINIQQDIVLVIGSAIALISLLILAVARSFRWALIIFVPMGLGVLWSLGLALITVGHLTLITASFMAILFGLGADYGIFTSSRIAEERRAGKPLAEAIGQGIGASFQAVLTAGGASVVIFGALATVEFPGFAELGLVAAKGVVLILLSTWMVQPALYALLPPKLPERLQEPPSPAAASPGRGAFSRPLAFAGVMLAVGCAAIGAVRGFAIPFDYDVLSLLPADSQAARYQRRMVAESDYQAEVVIFTARDMGEARRITEAAGKLESIAKVQSITPLFPADGEARLEKIKAIADSLTRLGLAQQLVELNRAGLTTGSFERLRSILKEMGDFIDESQEQAFSAGHSKLVRSLEQVRGMAEAIQAKIDQDADRGRGRSESFLRALLANAENGLGVIDGWRDAKLLAPDQLPPALRDRFFAGDGSIAVYAFPAKSVYDPTSLDRLMQESYGVSPDATGFPSTHQAFSKSVVSSFTQGTVLAVVACLLWLALVLRSLRGILLASLPLLMGGGWMLGIMSLTGMSYNYANIVALPLVIALAVDYGVWFNYRWLELKDNTPLQVTLIAGKVIGLAAGTELAGLGAITLAKYRGVSTLGVNITIGLLCCLAATLLVAPAIAQLLNPRRKP